MRNSAYVNTYNQYDYTATVYTLEDLILWAKSEGLTKEEIASMTIHKAVGNEIERQVQEWIDSHKEYKVLRTKTLTGTTYKMGEYKHSYKIEWAVIFNFQSGYIPMKTKRECIEYCKRSMKAQDIEVHEVEVF